MTARQNRILKRRLANERVRAHVRKQRQFKKPSGTVIRLGEPMYQRDLELRLDRLWKGWRVEGGPFYRPSDGQVLTIAPRKLNKRLLGKDLVLVRDYHGRAKSRARWVPTRMIKILASVGWDEDPDD